MDAYFGRLEAILIDFPADVVVNLGGTVHYYWVDARTKTRIVPEDFSDVTSRSRSNVSRKVHVIRGNHTGRRPIETPRYYPLPYDRTRTLRKRIYS
jgi:hypothetical protein